MSAAKLLFGKKKSEKKKNAEIEAASRKLTEVLHVLEKKSEHYESKINEQLKTAKKHASKNKRLALGALKRKRRYEEEHARLQATITTLEFQLDAISSAKLSSEVVAAMGKAKTSLDAAHKGLDLERINNLHDSVEEQLQISNELGQAISEPVMDGQFDEDELLEELKALELDGNLTNIHPVRGRQEVFNPAPWPTNYNSYQVPQPQPAAHRVALNVPYQPAQPAFYGGISSDGASAVNFESEGSSDEDDAAAGASGVRIGGPGGGRPPQQEQLPFWMPDIPTDQPVAKPQKKKKSKEQDDINALQAWGS